MFSLDSGVTVVSAHLGVKADQQAMTMSLQGLTNSPPSRQRGVCPSASKGGPHLVLVLVDRRLVAPSPCASTFTKDRCLPTLLFPSRGHGACPVTRDPEIEVGDLQMRLRTELRRDVQEAETDLHLAEGFRCTSPHHNIEIQRAPYRSRIK